MRTDPIVPLTERQRQVAGLIAEGYIDKVIACRLGISPCTVRAHLHKLARKFQVSSDKDVRTVVTRYVVENEPYRSVA